MNSSIQSRYMFKDATEIYSNYMEQYNTFKKGLVILGPPAIGKTYYVRNQIDDNNHKVDWVDMDDLFNSLGLDWHRNEDNPIDFKLNYKRADYLCLQSKALGFRLIGALYYKYVPDGIVIPPLKKHYEYMKLREFDQKMIDKTIDIRDELFDLSFKNNVTVYESVDEAINDLTVKS